MSLPCIQAARSFRPDRHLPFLVGGERVGWIAQEDAGLLQRWPRVFQISGSAVQLATALDSVESRSAALAPVIRALADGGRIRGWRDETYAIRNGFDAPPLALIERAAARFFGTLSFAVHGNGIVAPSGAAPRLWIARRSLRKPIDPGLYDNVVGGGIGWGYGIGETLVKECQEESGIPAALAGQARAGRSVQVLAQHADGVQWERIYVYDLPLPEDFIPSSQDGEVSEHRLVSIDEVQELIAAGAMTVDASLATLDWLLRGGHVDSDSARFSGFEQLPASESSPLLS